jgi:hypothetical protein
VFAAELIKIWWLGSLICRLACLHGCLLSLNAP